MHACTPVADTSKDEHDTFYKALELIRSHFKLQDSLITVGELLRADCMRFYVPPTHNTALFRNSPITLSITQ